jgi:CRISPR/Cas system-associated protein Cas5 (RAMP superfamily)
VHPSVLSGVVMTSSFAWGYLYPPISTIRGILSISTVEGTFESDKEALSSEELKC